MGKHHRLKPTLAACAASVCLGPMSTPLQAVLTDISNTPMSSFGNSLVLPNLMFVLDDSGSMAWDYLPDHVDDRYTCKSDNTSDDSCGVGDPPYYAAGFNGVYYNPSVTYKPAVRHDGSSMPSQTDPTAVLVDAFTSSATVNIAAEYPEAVYCRANTDPNNPANYPAQCRRNGYNNINTALVPFVYLVGTQWGADSYPDSTYNRWHQRKSAPFYFRISAREYCDTSMLTNCTAATAPTGAFIHPAPVRFCNSLGAANAPAGSSSSNTMGGTPKCQAKYTTAYRYSRYGTFTRTNIVPTVTSYPKAPTRVDCAGASCTYAEEITNFGNWFAYYRTRMNMMKSVAGMAFEGMDNRYRVGFVTLNTGKPVAQDKYLKVDSFGSAHKQQWFARLYSQVPGGLTPLREALSRVGRHYAGKTDDVNEGMPEDPVQYSCQQNFTILTTDGYWNSSSGQKIDRTAIGNQDNLNQATPPIYSSRATGTYDGGLTGAGDTLADVAMYYYKTDLRASGSIGALGADVSKDNVARSPKDFAAHQHMTTFTIGIVDGLMTYRADYETASTGDFANIKAGANSCSWATGTCNWPVPAANGLSALDDLWHAAVNGRGSYYSARDPATLTDGLSGAISGIKVRNAAAAASATSSPNITPSDRSIFSSTYTTIEWAGEVVSQDIDPATGTVVPTIKWSAQAGLDTQAGASTDSRTIYMFDGSAPNRLKPFQFTSMNAAEQGYFKDRCVPLSTLSQCVGLSAAQLADANSGTSMVNYLRGQRQFEGSLYRRRVHILGDTVNATPAFVREPRQNFADAGYGAFKAANTSRQAMLYVGANDGFLHALDADTGGELWAFAPSMVLPNLYKLAEDNYATKHLYFVDAAPEVMDVYAGGAWRTILVGGLGAGGRGYYALDITAPAAPKALWEFCHDSASCATSDQDLGLTYATPVITKRASDGRWVVLVTSGYNNVSPGTGRGYLYVLDAITGNVLQKIDDGNGDTASPSGLGKIAAWADSFSFDPTSKYVYGADLTGTVYRFDLTVSPGSVQKLARLTDASGRPQPVTTRPELSLIEGYRVLFIGTGRYLGLSDLQDPAALTPPSGDAYQQSVYAFKDKGMDYGDIRIGATLVAQSITVIDSTMRSTTGNTVSWSTRDGWYVDLNPGNQSPGERVTVDPQLVLGTLLVVTNVPRDDACSTGGDSWLYQFNYSTGTYVSTAPFQTVANKLSNAIAVGAVVFRLPNGQLKTIVTDATGTKTPAGVNTGGTPAGGKRTSWRELVR